MEIGTGKAAVPNASGVASAATAQVTGTATKGVGGLPGVTGEFLFSLLKRVLGVAVVVLVV